MMLVRNGKIGDIETVIIEGTALGSFQVGPLIIDSGVVLQEPMVGLLRRKARLLSDLLQNESLLGGVRSLYGHELDVPPVLVTFGYFPKDSSGAGCYGKTPPELMEMDGFRFAHVELNVIDAEEGMTDGERVFGLWAGLCSTMLCHSPLRPSDQEAVLSWAESEAKRAWLFALQSRTVNPRRRFVMGLERMYSMKMRPTPTDPGSSKYVVSLPVYFHDMSRYLALMKRANEHLSPGANLCEKLDYLAIPQWRWNDTAGFVDINVRDDGLIADFHITTTRQKILAYGSVEPGTARARHGRVFRFFNHLTWRTTSVKEAAARLDEFYNLVSTYVRTTLGWFVPVEEYRSVAWAIDSREQSGRNQISPIP